METVQCVVRRGQLQPGRFPSITFAQNMTELLHKTSPDLTFHISLVKKETIGEYIRIICPEEICGDMVDRNANFERVAEANR